MFATRNNDENVIHQQHAAAASKPLNQGLKGLPPKTPANKPAAKTPSRKGLNDENVVFGPGTVGGKGGLFDAGGLKGGKVDKTAFVTPAGKLFG